MHLHRFETPDCAARGWSLGERSERRVTAPEPLLESTWSLASYLAKRQGFADAPQGTGEARIYLKESWESVSV